MKKLISLKLARHNAIRATAFSFSLLLAACATPPSDNSAKAPVTGGTPQPVPETKLPAAGPAPTVLISGRKPQAILDDIVKYRTGKGMKLRNRTSMKVEFAETITSASQPTEARMVYLLSPGAKGLNLSARVFQVSYPGTARERVAEITSVVADKLSRELAGYNTSSGW